jgi:uncharacterized protein (DUF2267 family)
MGIDPDVRAVAACQGGVTERGGGTMRHREEKAAEDRHIGFRWLKRESGLASEHEAEELFRSVAHALASRVGPGEARHVASHLPVGLREVWDEETAAIEEPQRFGLATLDEYVARRLGLGEEDEPDWRVELVFAWLKYLAPEEREDVGGRLPPDIRAVWERAALYKTQALRRPRSYLG